MYLKLPRCVLFQFDQDVELGYDTYYSAPLKQLRRGVLAKDLPEAVLDMMMSKNITRALTARGLSFPHVLAKSCFAGLQLALAFTFLIIGFNAFSDPKDPAAGMLNSALTLILAVVGLQLGRAVDLEEMHEQVCVCACVRTRVMTHGRLLAAHTFTLHFSGGAPGNGGHGRHPRDH